MIIGEILGAKCPPIGQSPTQRSLSECTQQDDDDDLHSILQINNTFFAQA